MDGFQGLSQEKTFRKQDVLFLVVFQLALGLSYLKTVPRFYMDEAWEASLGHSLAAEGTLHHGFIKGWGGMHVHYVQNQVVLPWVCAAIYRIAGFGIVSSRIGSLLISVLAVISVYGLTCRWFGRKQAVVIGLAVILHPWFFEVSRRVRPEIYYIALSLTALWCMFSSLESDSKRSAFCAGIIAGLAGLAHPTGLVLDFAFIVALLVWYRSRKLARILLWAGLGFMISVLPYVLYVIWSIQDPQVSFFRQMSTGRLSGPLLAGEIGRWKHFFQWPKGAPLALFFLISWLAAWYRSSSADKMIATTIIVFAILLPFSSVNVTSRYLVSMAPLFCILMVRMVWRMVSDVQAGGLSRHKYRIVAGLGVVFIYAAVSIGAISILLHRHRKADLDNFLDGISSVVDRDSRVFGEMLFWMGHDRYRYGPYPMDFSVIPWRQTVAMVREHKFDYAIRSAWNFLSSMGVAEPPQSMPEFRDSNTIDQVCRRYGTKVAEFRDPFFGPVEIYKLDWNKI